MEKSSEFGYQYHQHPYRMSPNNRSLFHSNTKPVAEIPHLVEESTFMFPFSGFQHMNTNNSRSWLYNNTLHYHDAFPPLFNPARIEDFPAFDLGRQRIPTAGPSPPEKKFLVYDQSGDKTAMIYNFKVQIGTSRVPSNPPNAYNLSREEGLIRVSSNSNTSNTPLRQSMDDCEATEEDEMHEDTEELNALLSTDDEYDDDEETSTGHSPSTVIDNGSREPVEEIGEEEVDSFAGRPTNKRWRTQHGPTALGADDAESVYFGFDKRCKRFRREKIHETLRALRGLIPDAEGKDAVVVIDEAVNYLRSLKVKAKALGLDAL